MSVSPDLPSPAHVASPIADVSYRHYDGPIRRHPFRWWIVTRAMLRTLSRRWWVYLLAAFSVVPYLISAFLLYMVTRIPPELAAMTEQRPLQGYFYDAYHYSLFPLFILALLAGASSIAGDNRTNALQIYFSKPLTKFDYLAGKWASLFILIATITLAPGVALYLFGLATFWDKGFLKEYPTLIFAVIGSALLPAALHASLLVGLSAWSRRPMLVGGIYAGIYMGIGVVVSIVMVIVLASKHREAAATVAHLSLPGILRGISQHMFDASPSIFGGVPTGPNGEPMPRPDLLPVALVGAALMVLGIAAARARIRAVEVIRG